MTVPSDLSAPARKWVEEIERRYTLAVEHRILLHEAARAWDRAQAARKLLAKEGLVIRGSRGVATTHPAAKIAADAQAFVLRALGKLGLGVEVADTDRSGL